MRSRLFNLAISVVLLVAGLMSQTALAQTRAAGKRPRGSICGNPRLVCKTTATFNPNDLPFRVPQNSVIFDTEPFYAIVLKSVTTREDNCDIYVPEKERLQAQVLFPDRKVFASRCADIENLFYTNVDPKFRIMAVYGGATLAEAKRVLETVKATGKFTRAYIRRMRTGFNGT